jgi:hypothetical protein
MPGKGGPNERFLAAARDVLKADADFPRQF